MTGVSTDLSAGLQALLNDLSGGEDASEIVFEQADFRKLLDLLRVMQALATNLEIELRCLRDIEAAGEAHGIVESEATAQLADMLGELEGKVLRPNFGRRS